VTGLGESPSSPDTLPASPWYIYSTGKLSNLHSGSMSNTTKATGGFFPYTSLQEVKYPKWVIFKSCSYASVYSPSVSLQNTGQFPHRNQDLPCEPGGLAKYFERREPPESWGRTAEPALSKARQTQCSASIGLFWSSSTSPGWHMPFPPVPSALPPHPKAGGCSSLPAPQTAVEPIWYAEI
jgi:hypothetical protein